MEVQNDLGQLRLKTMLPEADDEAEADAAAEAGRPVPDDAAFDDLVAEAGAVLAERFPRRLAHLQVLVEEVPPSDPAPWDAPTVLLGRVIPPTREHPAQVIVYRRPLQTRCATEDELETLVRQVLSEQIGSLLSIAPEDVDPEAWDL